MTARAEYLYLAAGGTAIAGGFATEGGWPAKGTEAAVGTLALALVGAVLDKTALAPVARGFGWLLLLAAVYGAVPALQGARVTHARAKGRNAGNAAGAAVKGALK